jgi:putative peptidoglycan lipid II flippase
MIAGFLGSGPVADAFFVAFRLPNMFRRFFAEGAFNMAFVPLYAKRLEGEGRAAARAFAEETLTVLLTALLAMTALALAFMPALVFLLAAGFADDPERFDLAVLYGRIQFPYLLCMSLTALFSGMLNAMGRFTAPAAAPLLLNAALIGAMTLAGALAWPVGDALAWGVFVAGFAQVALVALAAREAGSALRLRAPRLTPGVRRLIRLGVPGAASGGVVQINLLIGTVIASFFAGAVSWLSYADRLYQLPLGVVGVAIGVVLLPELARRVRAGDHESAREGMNRAAEFALLLTLPAAVALLAIPGEIAAGLFERGAFTRADTDAVAAAIALYALGLPSFVLQKVVQPAFFAREDMVSPLRYAAVAVGVNTAIALVGAPVFGWLAIPFGTTVAGWLHLWLLWRGAARFGGEALIDERLAARAPQMLKAALTMGVGLILFASVTEPSFESGEGRTLALVAAVAVGAGVYAWAALRFRAVSREDLGAALSRR